MDETEEPRRTRDGRPVCPHCWSPSEIRLTGKMEDRVFRWWNSWTREDVEPLAAYMNGEGMVDIFWREGGKTGYNPVSYEGGPLSLETIFFNSRDESNKWVARLKRTPPRELVPNDSESEASHEISTP